MKRKINQMLICVSVMAVLLTGILICMISYSTFRRQVLTDLKTYADVLEHVYTVDSEIFNSYDSREDDLRVTVISQNGTVIFDSIADSAQLDNHNDRPEIQQARERGEGSAVRLSETIGSSTFYYALRMTDGRIVRVGRETSSIWHILWQAFPVILICLVLILAACFLLSSYLTGKLVRPISDMADKLDTIEPYQVEPELRPFVATIQKQHQDILNSALMRQEFTANVSHELKTPLTSISGYAELIASGMVQQRTDIERFAGEIQQNASRLLTLINDIIQLSALDSQQGIGQETMQSEASYQMVDLYELAQNCQKTLSVSAGMHGITLRCQGSSCQVRGNKEQLEEVISNLCDNAIRYNHPGGNVWLSVTETPNEVILSVADDGIGIPKEHQSRIFERFYRVDKSRSKRTGGTGLGLAIVKHIVMQHGAKIQLESEEGKGTVIEVRFGKKM